MYYTNKVTLGVKSVSEIIYKKRCSRRFGGNHGPSSGEVEEKFMQKHRYK